ncbi:MAG: glycosyltransferase family 2 protein [Candidatus Nomurabacteria bacterium]|nr:MAG: glycosyltransferase family 2 protein [Candidatus Nomurabacteria bacterium]
MSGYAMLKPKERRSQDTLEEIDRVLREHKFGTEIPVQIHYGGIVEPLTRSKRVKALDKKHKESNAVKARLKKIKNDSLAEAECARILAIVPTFEKEDEIDKTVISLLLQTRQIDQIVVVINGPGESDAAYNAILPLVREFRDQLIVERPEQLNGRNEDGSSRGSKVNTLNWMYWRYIQMGDFDFVLGIDADIEADKDMVHHLETDLIRRVKAAGVMARYSFKIPSKKNMRGKSLSLIQGQRHEFAVTGIKHQLRGYKSDILGGQATLFRAKALRESAQVTDGGAPWDQESLVEDAQLTRTLQKLGYSTATSGKARAWTGLMYTAYAWQRQRRKWQDGHFDDMIRDFQPWGDRRRWLDQLALGWNLILRVLFAVVLITSIAINKFEFSPIWFIPVALAIIQSVLVATKVPNRTFREIVRSFLFIPGEIYYMRTLAVWLDSTMVTVVNIRRDGWGNQQRAETAQRTTAISSWLLILSAVTLPSLALLMANRILPDETMGNIVTYLWYTVTILTIGSTFSMARFILRMLRNYRTIAP